MKARCHCNMYKLSINLHFKYSQSSRDQAFQYLDRKKVFLFFQYLQKPTTTSCFISVFDGYELHTEQNFALDVEIQKLGKPHWPRPSNVLYSELIMYLVTGGFTVTQIIHPWSTKIGKIDIFACYKPCKNETRKSNSTIDMVTDDKGMIFVTLKLRPSS